MINDVIIHILHYKLAMKRLINYCIFKIKFSCTLRTFIQFIPHITRSAQTLHYIILHYITLHYITMVFCNLHCIYIKTKHV